MPQISPKKTIEGSIGGLFGSCLAAGLFHLKLPHIPLPALICLGFAVGLVGQMGDLFESMLKRVANQKDSGSLMPGHGGVLDRLDGVLFAAPVMFAGVSLLEILF
jgi:phosphatidate cytidylyltransferase